jgi:ATP-dependent RNA helicase RhlE
LTSDLFRDLGLAEPLLRALQAQGFDTPTPIQTQAIPPILAGHDLVGLAQTGTGKTAAFALPLLHLIAATRAPGERSVPRALILAPTRELAIQIEESVTALSRHLPLQSLAILGGVGRRPQAARLARGVDIVVGTPGRVLDLIGGGELKLAAITHFVLDEADRMLDIGFLPAIRRIAAGLPRARQSLLFSATMPQDVARLAESLLRDPVRVEAARETLAPAQIAQQVYFVPGAEKRALLGRLLENPAIARAIVFTRTKHGANRVAEHLGKDGVRAEAIHGNKSQSARQKSLDRFRSGQARVLVATDIAARGIDVAEVTHVINFDLPDVPESYVHRIGRTARAGASGIALSFCDASEAGLLRDIERVTGRRLDVAGGTPPAARGAAQKARPGGRGRAPQRARAA